MSVSRAVRTPSNYEENSRISVGALPGPGGLTALVTLLGNRNLRSEQLLAYEGGYRMQPARRVSLDVASFYNVYHHLIGENLPAPFLELIPSPPHVVIPLQFANNHDGKSYGVELTGSYIPLSFWKITGSYSWLRMRLHPADAITSFPVGGSPSHTFQAHSYLSLRRNFEFDNGFYWVDRLSGQPVPPYLRVDTKLAWHPQERLEFSVSGQNLLRPQHPEFMLPIDIQGANEVSRTVYGKITWQF
jgi:iron complex outermembrane receptor protein